MTEETPPPPTPETPDLEAADDLLDFIHSESGEVAEEELLLTEIKSSAIPADQIAQSWQEARAYITKLNLTSNYSAPVRVVLKAKSTADDHELRKIMMDQIFPYLIRVSPSFQSLFYFALQEYYPKQFSEVEDGSIIDVLNSISVDDVLSILTLAYVKSSFQKLLLDDNEKALFKKRLREYISIGRLIGEALNDGSPSQGMLIGGVIQLGFSMLVLADVDVFRKYRQKLKRQKLNYDLKEEYETWGCHHFQIAALLLQEFGFGRSMALGIFSELSAFLGKDSDSLQCWTVKELLCEILGNGDHVSHLTSTVDLIGTSAWEDLLTDSQSVVERSENDIWIDMRKNNLTADKLKQLKQFKWP